MCKNGATLAEAGEFTKRAFLNGKLSLEKAEGIIDMINAESINAVKAGYKLLSGELGIRVVECQKYLTDCQAQIEVALDFPENDVEFETLSQIKNRLKFVKQNIIKLLQTAKTGKIVKNGVNILILGKPNAGKSSLMNALLGYNRAIVTDVAGTTRDIIEDSYLFKGMKFNLTDTAGIRDADNIVERIGIEKAEECVNSADIVLVVLDSSKPLESEDKKILSLVKNKDVIYVFNKTDLPKKINERFDDMIEISALKRERIQDLKDEIYDVVVDKIC